MRSNIRFLSSLGANAAKFDTPHCCNSCRVASKSNPKLPFHSAAAAACFEHADKTKICYGIRALNLQFCWIYIGSPRLSAFRHLTMEEGVRGGETAEGETKKKGERQATCADNIKEIEGRGGSPSKNGGGRSPEKSCEETVDAKRYPIAEDEIKDDVVVVIGDDTSPGSTMSNFKTSMADGSAKSKPASACKTAKDSLGYEVQQITDSDESGDGTAGDLFVDGKSRMTPANDSNKRMWKGSPPEASPINSPMLKKRPSGLPTSSPTTQWFFSGSNQEERRRTREQVVLDEKGNMACI